MNEKDIKILTVIANAIPKMSEFEKGYFLGVAESKAAGKKKDTEERQPVAV